MKQLTPYLFSLALIAIYHFTFNTQQIPLGFVENQFVGFTNEAIPYQEYERDTIVMKDEAGKVKKETFNSMTTK